MEMTKKRRPIAADETTVKDHFTTHEAAEVLEIPVGTVKSRLHAAIQKLNEALTPTDIHGDE